jgi:hypothetical protein
MEEAHISDCCMMLRGAGVFLVFSVEEAHSDC